MRILPFLLIAFLCFKTVNAQVEFQKHTIADKKYSVKRPEAVFSIDLDNDGDLDALSASTDKIAWYENIDGLGNFGVQQILEEGDVFATSIFSIDVDNDGDNDVISILRLVDEIVWYENIDGNGNFSEKKVITNNADWGTSVYAADIDNDGDMDVISASQNDNKIAWYENIDGLGGFGSQQIISTSANGAQSIYVADIDGDGDMDVISASESDNKIAWYENTDGLGNFVTKIITTSANGVKSIHANDFDNDGDIDILYAAWPNGNRVGWYENTNGLGNFVFHKIYYNVSSSDEATVYSNDIDNDGDIDVIASTNGDLTWFENVNGLGDFGSGQTIYDGSGVNGVYLSDFDDDGNIDIIAAINGSDLEKIAWFKNIDGLGGFSSFKTITIDNDGPRSIYSTDLDGDEDMDILMAYFEDGKVVWYENKDGLGDFGDEKIISKQSGYVSIVSAADLDGDGDMDVLENGGNGLSWHENTNGLGDFMLKATIGAANSVHGTDVDGDGDIDLVCHSNVGRIYWYENLDGLGSFSTSKNIMIDKVTTIHLDDFDSDGDADVLFASFDENKISWIENTSGLGDFGLPQVITNEMVGVRSIYPVDVDGDGDSDVLSASSDNINVEKEISWYENMDGLGNFGSPQIISSSYRAGLVYGADLDNDNDIDVISTGARNSTIIWHENLDGLGNFGQQQIIRDNTTSTILPSVFVTDIDGDYNQDIIYSPGYIQSSFEPQLVWYENSGTLFNVIEGSVKIDVDSNGCDISDLPMPNLMIITNDGLNEYATFTQDDGGYELFTKEGRYTTVLTSLLPDYLNGMPYSQPSVFAGYNNVDDNNDFCLEFTQAINDVNISLYPRLEARPGFDTAYRLVYKNVGTSQLDGNVELEFDGSKLSFISANETVSSQTSNSIIFDYNNLNPFETRIIDLNFNVFIPPTTDIGDVLNFTATVNPISGDKTESDNVFELNQIVIGSYDPNDIQVLEGVQISIEDADEYLHYIIRFQNTGTADAINVRVDNLLNDKLDWTTFQLENSSHTNRVEIENGNEVSFVFNGIYLSDSNTNEPNSHGFVAYKVKPKSDVVVGDLIPNQADIFFDFNPAITTNIVTTEITSVLNIEKTPKSKFHIFPIPTKNVLKVQSQTRIKSIEIYNNLGQVVLTESKKSDIDLTTITSGFYFIKVKDVLGNSGVKKFFKK